MKHEHLSVWDREEYVIGQRTPAMVQHIAQCEDCRSAIAATQEDLEFFRDSAIQWSADCLERSPRSAQVRRSAVFLPAFRWALAALLLAVLLPLSLMRTGRHVAPSPQPDAAMSDDALLQQVDEEVSEEVPSSMEPLTHLVSAGTYRAPADSRPFERTAEGSHSSVQSN